MIAPLLAALQVDVDLDLSPVAQCVPPNSVISIELELTAESPVTIAGVDAILTWDPSTLTLIGGTGVDGGWFGAGFLNDPSGINLSTTDGDALFTLFANPSPPPLIDETPLTAARFEFFALADGELSVPARLLSASTQVVGLQPGADLTGSLPLPASVGVVKAAPALEVVRLGTPPNPNVLLPGVTSGPVIGATWDPVIDHSSFVPDSLIDVLAFSLTPTNLSLPGLGTILCLPPSVVPPANAVPGQPFEIPLPVKCSLVGASVCSQALSLEPNGALRLTNALDITFGTL